MRILLAPALLLAACGPALAAAPSPFRSALAAAGGCGQHRVLAEDRLGRLDAAQAPAVPQGEADLFGKPAGLWTEGEIRDALAAFAACETYPGPSAGNARARLARDLRGLEAALRRAIVVGHAGAPAETDGEAPSRGSGSGHTGGAAPGSAGSGRLRQGPAFTPAARTASAAAEGPSLITAARTPAAAGPVPDERALPVAAPSAPSPAPVRNAELSSRRGPIPVVHRPAAEQAPCVLSPALFTTLQAEMAFAEIETLIGCRGSIDSTATIPGLGTFETYLWSDRANGATLTLVFQDRRLKSKAQRGLLAEAGRGG